MKALFLILTTFAVVSAQAHDEASRLEPTANPGVFKFIWLGKSGRTYFVQNSQDLQNWATLPLIEVGSGERIEYGFTTDAPRFFFRLRFSDLPAGDVLTADFDGDGISNWNEIQQGLDPFKPDTDGDGMSDGYELAFGLNPLLADGAGDLDGDGVRNDEDARPNGFSIGRLDVTVNSPINGRTYP
jgi:hypothetical protein